MPANRSLRRAKRDLQQQQQGFLAQVQTYQGPFPPPEILRELDDLVPGCAATILSDAHDQTQHRISTEKRIVGHDIARSWAGLGVGAVMGLSGLVVAYALAKAGHPSESATVAQFDVGGFAGVFVIGAGIRFWERLRKYRELTGL